MQARILLIILAILATQFSVFATEMISATITYEDGSVKMGTIEFPLTSNAKTVKVVLAKGNTQILNTDQLRSIDIRTSSGKEYHLERIYVLTYDKRHKETYQSVNRVWAFRLRTDSKMDYYTIGSEYQIRKKERDMEVISKGALGQVMHCFIRPGEAGATSVHSPTGGGVLVGTDKYFLRSLIAYFNDDSKLSTRIADGDFKKESLLSVYQEYCK